MSGSGWALLASLYFDPTFPFCFPLLLLCTTCSSSLITVMAFKDLLLPPLARTWVSPRVVRA